MFVQVVLFPAAVLIIPSEWILQVLLLKKQCYFFISKFLREYLIDINDRWIHGLTNSSIFPYINPGETSSEVGTHKFNSSP